MSTLLVKNARLLVTMDEGRREIGGGGVFIRDRAIEAVGPSQELPQCADRVIDAEEMLILPGLVNTHHHLYQTLTRCLPLAQDATLFDWLRTLYPVWANLTGEAVYVSALVGLAELISSGCTTSLDHLYIFPHDVRLEDEIRAAEELGIRFHSCRGAMSLGRSKGGLPPDSVVEEEDAILADCRRVVEAYHDSKPYSMCQVIVSPCSPFSVTPDLMREGAQLARSYKVRLHTHVAETLDEEAFCLEKYGCRPVRYAADLGWVGKDVSYAHSIHVNEEEIGLLAQTGTAVAHCPTSNMRLGSGIAPVREMLDAGVRVGLAVDGSASNDSSNMLAEARMAMLLQRVKNGPGAITAREALEMATLGGARLLGREDIGSLAPGKAADLIGIRADRLEYAGAHDLLAASVFCSPAKVHLSLINGRVVVDNGNLTTLDLERVIARHNNIAKEMIK